MLKATKQFLLVLALVATLCVVAILVAGISQLAEAASAYDARLGPIVAWSLTILFLLLLLWPLVLFLRFPKPLIPPDDPAEQPAYLAALTSRLRTNPLLKGRPLETDDDLGAALEFLARRADEVTEEAATRVFLGTALLQNGRLDALVVLAMQLDLVWKIAAIYHQSPSPRQMGYLYANVGATAFLASEIEEIDFAEMVQPLVYSSLSGIPGAMAFSSILVNSLSTGAANAFLTLRVGAVARLYCEATTSPVRGAVRRSAIASAAKHLGRILQRNVTAIISAFADTARKAAGSGMSKVTDSARSVRDSFISWLRPGTTDPGDRGPSGGSDPKPA
jgi:hypothetical protein